MWVHTNEDNEAAKALCGTTGAQNVSRLMYTWELQ